MLNVFFCFWIILNQIKCSCKDLNFPNYFCYCNIFHSRKKRGTGGPWRKILVHVNTKSWIYVIHFLICSKSWEFLKFSLNLFAIEQINLLCFRVFGLDNLCLALTRNGNCRLAPLHLPSLIFFGFCAWACFILSTVEHLSTLKQFSHKLKC